MLIVALSMLFGAAAAGAEDDPNDQISEAYALGMVPPARGVYSGLSSSTDVNMYSFEVQEGAAVEIIVAVDLCVESAKIRLFDAAGQQLDQATISAWVVRLHYTFATGGTYYVGVSSSWNRRYDPLTGSGDQSGGPANWYMLTVKPVVPSPADGDDQISEALPLGTVPPARTVSGEIAVPDDVDMYSLEVAAGSMVRIDLDIPGEAEPEWFSLLRLFDSGGRLVMENEQGEAPGEPDRGLSESYLEYLVPKGGTYYLGVSTSRNDGYGPWTGERDWDEDPGGFYQLFISAEMTTNDTDPDDQLAEAAALGSVPPTRQTTGAIDAGLDVDMYSFTMVAGATVGIDLDADVGSGLDSVLRLFDSSGQQLATNDNGAAPGESGGWDNWDSYLVHTFQTAGTYYVGVSGWGNVEYDAISGDGDVASEFPGGYTLFLAITAPPANDPNDQISEARALGSVPPTRDVDDALAVGDDVNMYSFTVVAGATVGIDLDLVGMDLWGALLRLFDGAGNQLASNDLGAAPGEDDPFVTGESYIEYTFPSAGTYYVGVGDLFNTAYDPLTGGGDETGMSSGGYSLHVVNIDRARAREAGDADDQIAEATALGSLPPTLAIVGTIWSDTDVNMYSFEVASGTVVCFETPHEGHTVRIFDAEGNELTANGFDAPGYGYENREYFGYFEHWFANAGTYYVGMSGGGHDVYDPVSGADTSPGTYVFGADYEWTASCWGVLPTQWLDLTSPNGGEIWNQGTTQTIRWESRDVGGDVRLELLQGDGPIPVTIVASTPNDGEYAWAIPASGPAGEDFRVRLTSTANPNTMMDVSAAPFTLRVPGATRHALFVGVGYFDPVALPSAELLFSPTLDAQRMNGLLLSDAEGRWPNGNAAVLLDSDATKAAVRAKLAEMATAAKAGDTVFYFHSSHGGDTLIGEGFVLTHDGYYWDHELGADLAGFADGVEVVVCIEACHSAGMYKGVGPWDFAGRAMAAYREARIANCRAAGKGVSKTLGSNIAFITSSDADEYSYAWVDAGVMTTYLLESCEELDADLNQDGEMTFWEMYVYAAAEVELRGDEQHPQHPQYLNEALLRDVFVWSRGGDTVMLSIGSRNPETGVTIGVSVPSLHGIAVGDTPMSRVYKARYPVATVTFTAPASAGGNAFVRWEDGGVSCGTSRNIEIPTTRSRVLTAVYAGDAPGNCAAVRTIVGAGVSIAVQPTTGVSAWQVVEQIPFGLTPAGISGPNGAWNPAARQIVWSGTNANAANLGYTVSGPDGAYWLFGSGSANAQPLFVTGDRTLTLGDGTVGRPCGFAAGWNSFGMVLVGSGAPTTASGLAAWAPDCTSVAGWNAATQSWRTYVPGVGGSDFALTVGHAYMLQCSEGSRTVSGDWQTAAAIGLAVGHNLVALGERPPASAAALVTALGADCQGVWRWRNEAQRWEGWVAAFGGEDFPLEPGQPLVVAMHAPGAWPVP